MRNVECGIGGPASKTLAVQFRIPNSAFRIRFPRVTFTLSRKQKLLIAAALLTPIVLFVLYTWSALTWSYSKGERAGYVQKFSKKGWICKTWEGELAMVALPGAMPEMFYFTVRHDSVAVLVNAALGRRVALAYEQHKGLPTRCFGETEYFVTNVKVVD